MDNYYKILGIKKESSIEEIKKAYLNELKKYHPDIYKGDTVFAQDKTAQLNHIYGILKDESLRKDYDLRTFGSSVLIKKDDVDPGIFEELKIRLKTGLNLKSKQEKLEIKKNKKLEKLKRKQEKQKLKQKEENDEKEYSCLNDEVINDYEEPVVIDEEKLQKIEKTRLYLMISSILVGLVLIIVLCLCF